MQDQRGCSSATLQSLQDKISSLKKENSNLARKIHIVNNIDKYEEYFTDERFDFVSKIMMLESSVNQLKSNAKKLTEKNRFILQQNKELIRERTELLAQLAVYKT